MRFALNHRGEHVRADAVGPYAFGLCCPVCKEPVFARPGSIREAHFAHHSGNSNKACDLYYPGGGDGSYQYPDSARTRTVAKERLGAPALLWRSGEALAASLYLRLPTHPDGFPVTVQVTSFASSRYDGNQLRKAQFVRLRLKAPPAQVDTSPRDESIEQALAETLTQFQLNGNFFRATGEGGVLIAPDQPLELGQAYWLVTQSTLRKPVCEYVRVEEHRSDRAWHAYRFELACSPADTEFALVEVARYLGREIVEPRPKVTIVWPPPMRRDPDGVRVFQRDTSHLLVRSPLGSPHLRSVDQADVVPEGMDGDLFQIPVPTGTHEALLGLAKGRWERLRFEDCELHKPNCVWVGCADTRLALFEPSAGDLLASVSSLQLDVPVHRLWRNILVDVKPIRPMPDGLSCFLEGVVSEIDAGAFGAARRQKSAVVPTPSHWSSKSQHLVRVMKGDRAADALRSVNSKAKLLRWAHDHEAAPLLPKLLCEVSKGAA